MSENLTREWINFSDQMPFDKNYLSKSFNIPEEFLSYATDKDESARIEMDDETKSLLIIFDIPFEDQTDVAYYSSGPMSFIVTKEVIITNVADKKMAIGGGIVFRFGGTTGGGDIIGRYFEQKKGFALGQTLFVFDILVLTLSLSYIDIQHMMYTVIASFVFSQVVAVVQNGGYTVRGMLIISSKYAEISQKITDEIGRGATYLKAEGVYSGQDTKVIYVVLSPIQVQAVKGILAEIDPDAFVSIINVHEVIGSGFTYTEDLNL